MKHTGLILTIAVSALLGISTSTLEAAETLKVFGSMHEAIGRQQHQGRVSLQRLTAKPHFYGVGALAGLRGEITIVDSAVRITSVAHGDTPKAVIDAKAKGTLLAGQYVAEWQKVAIKEDVQSGQFDETIKALAKANGVDPDKPFVFMIEGEFLQVRLHVINGACPMHARMRRLELPPEKSPYERDAKRMKGTLIGVFALDAVGKLTHPATTTHPHLVFSEGGQILTGHLERVGIAAGAVVSFPK